MKKSIRNRILAVAAVSVSSFLMLSGFDSALTAEDVLNKAQEANADLNEFTADVNGTADVVLDVAAGGQTTSMPMNGSMDMNIQYSLSPFQCALTGTYAGDASAMGLSGEAGIEMYMVPDENEAMMIYARVTGVGDDSWQAVKMPEEYSANITDWIEKGKTGDLTALGEALGIDAEALQNDMLASAQLAPEAVNVNGKDCYELTIPVSGSQIYDVLSKMAEANPGMGVDQSALPILQMVLNTIHVSFVADYDVETFKPVYAKIDLSESDFSMIAQIVGSMMFSSASSESEAAPQIQLTVNALNMDMTYDMESPVSIEVPDEALNAEVTEVNMDDMAALADTAA